MSLIVERTRGIARPLALACFVLTLSLAHALLVALPAAQASSSCPNELLRTGPGANLPDCRAYEMVSPPQKNGGEVDGGVEAETLPAPQQAALNGESITYGAQTAFPEADPAAGVVTNQYLSRRTPAGWATQAITPEQDVPGGVFDQNPGSEELNLFTGFNEELTYGFLDAYEPAIVPGAPAGYFNPYLRDNASNSYQLLSDVKPPVEPQGPADGIKVGFTTEYAGMSTDGSHVAFTADDAITPGSLPGVTTNEFGNHTSNLYEWSNGRLELISVLPADEGAEAVQGRFGSVVYGANLVGFGEGYPHVLSADGDRAFWSYKPQYNSGTENEAAQLYMHELTASGSRTVRISASQITGGEKLSERDPAHYWDASVDGNIVFFTSCQRLTDASTAGGSCSGNGSIENEREDLYRYEVDTGTLTDLTVDPTPGQTASVQGVLGASEDGSYVYFVARGALAEGAPTGSEVFNVYVWHEGTVKLVTSTTGNDYFLARFRESQQLMKWGFSRVSSSGRYLMFESTEPLTGYDNDPVQAGGCAKIAGLEVGAGGGIYANETGRCLEVFEYDAQSGHLTCASCNPDGLPPVGDSVVPVPLHVIEHLRGWQSTTVQQRYLLDDGRVFFDSTDALLPQASNSGKLNVYEYEPGGVGSCQDQSGCLALISAGTSDENSFFADASASGNDVFFITRQSLVAQDGDEALDLYDARIDGGFSPATAPPCGGEACRSPATPAPAIYQAPPSATFVGPGNPPQAATPSGSATTQKPKAKGKPKPKKKSKKRKRKAKAKARHSRAQGPSGRSSR